MAHGKGPLRIAIEDFIETSPVFGFLGNWITKGIDFLEGSIKRSFINLVDKFLTRADLDVDTKDVVLSILAGEEQGGIMSLAGFGSSLGMSAASGLMAPYMRKMNYAMDKKLHTARLDPTMAIPAIWRSPEYARHLAEGMIELGYDEELILAITALASPTLGAGEQMALWLRHGMDDPEVDDELGKMGWSADRIEQMKELAEVIPGIPDLITMATREAWRDDVAAKFEYDTDFPEQVVEWAEKQGLSRDWVRRYWRAHWTLIGVREGFEMLHRLRPGTTDVPFTIDDMMTLLRTADIPRFFRERLVEIAYSPLTRVDVRRMYGMGVLDREAVLASYLDLGYNEENAERMTEFTVRFETQEQKDLTRTVIMSAYKRSVMRSEEAKTSLVDIGYNAEDADLFMAIADTEIAEEKQRVRLDYAEFLYTEGMINEQGVYSELGDLNLPSEQLADLIVRWEITKLKRIALPTKSELEDLYKRDIIDRDQFNDGLVKRRYMTETIAWYTERLDQRVVEDAAKAIERAQKEQERIEKAEYATSYQRLKAGMDVEIAVIKLQIADIKLAMNYMKVDADIAEGKENILALKSDIASWNLSKAEIKLAFIEGPEEEE